MFIHLESVECLIMIITYDNIKFLFDLILSHGYFWTRVSYSILSPRKKIERKCRYSKRLDAYNYGYATHISHDYEYFGKSIVSSSDNLLYDFTSCRKGQSMEYEPVTVACPDPPLLIQPSEIYHKHVGMIPNYLGHIPGAVFRYGKTFGANTIDAKKWLQGDSAL